MNTFQDFIKGGKVICGEPDAQKAKALVKMSENDLLTLSRMQPDEVTASAMFSILYDCLRKIMEAMTLLKGYKVYSHEAYTYYLKILHEESLAEEFDRLRRLRNGIDYDGKSVSAEIYVDAHQIVVRHRVRLISLYLEPRLG